MSTFKLRAYGENFKMSYLPQAESLLPFQHTFKIILNEQEVGGANERRTEDTRRSVTDGLRVKSDKGDLKHR